MLRIALENGRNATLTSPGTAFAIVTVRLGVPALLPHTTGRGGARNHASRQTHALSTAQVDNLIAATAHASSIGLPFTRMVTIHWESAGVALDGLTKVTGRFLDLLSKTVARHGSRTAYVWAHEDGPGKGAHSHLLVHVPASLVKRLTGLQRGWLRSVTGKPYRTGVIHSDPIGGLLGLEVGNPALHAANLEAALSYVLKAASVEAVAQFGLVRVEPGGLVIGKRCGTSQNIGPKARSAFAKGADPESLSAPETARES